MKPLNSKDEDLIICNMHEPRADMHTPHPRIKKLQRSVWSYSATVDGSAYGKYIKKKISSKFHTFVQPVSVTMS